jgi:SAM-dependent methyltransferase
MSETPDKIDFDTYVADYEKIINRHARLAGGSLEHFIGVRLSLVAELTKNDVPFGVPLQIVDFGCGIGVTEEQMLHTFPAATILGLDVSAGSIATAQKRSLGNVTFQTIVPGAPIPCADNSVDLIYSNGTFHHIAPDGHDFIFREMHRILRPGGNTFIFENNPFNPVTVLAMKQNPFDADARMIAPPKMRKRIQAAGFDGVQQGYYCFFLKPLTFMNWSERYLRWLPLGAQYYTRAVKRS